MKKLYLAGIVLLVSLLAVSAGEFPDDDDDGWCETPFCDKLDNCPKVACEQLELPIEGCMDPELNVDSDGDGAGDGCDECPNNPSIVFLAPGQVCTPPRRSSGGGGGGGGEMICGKCSDYLSDADVADYSCCSGTPQAISAVCDNLLLSLNKGISIPMQCEYVGPESLPAISFPAQAPAPAPVVAPPARQLSDAEIAQRQALAAGQQVPRQADLERAYQAPVRQESSAAGFVLLILAALAIGLLYTWYRRR